MWSPLLHELLCYVIGLEVVTDKGRSGREQSGGLHKDAGNYPLVAFDIYYAVLVNGLANVRKLNASFCTVIGAFSCNLFQCKRFKLDLSINPIEIAVKNNSMR
jgi:hypothetical protein